MLGTLHWWALLKRTLLYLGSIWPEANASAASSRVLSLVEAFLNADYDVVFSADGRENVATEYLRSKGVRCIRLAPNNSDFDSMVGELRPSVCVFDRFITEEKFGWRVQQFSPETLRVLDTIDLHFLRFARQKYVSSGSSIEPSWRDIMRLAGDLMMRELAAILRSDLSLLVSDDEIGVLRDYCLVPAELLLLSRITYPEVPPAPGFEMRSGFAMIGNFLHPPNEDAVHWVRDTIWPKLRARLPDAVLNVWGSHASSKHLALSMPESGFLVHGYANNQFEVLRQSRVNLAPLRFGAGVKGKIADGWYAGTPVVTTTIGIEGMTDKNTLGGIVANGIDQIVDAAVELYTNEKLWQEFSHEGCSIISKLYSSEATMSPVIEKISMLLVSLDEARARNILGQILWQQGLRSTEYFSRWIECKNSITKTQKPN